VKLLRPNEDTREAPWAAVSVIARRCIYSGRGGVASPQDKVYRHGAVNVLSKYQ
jgi:hypothetical protein